MTSTCARLTPTPSGLIESVPLPTPSTERAKESEGIKGELPSAMHPPSGCRFRTRCPIAQEICCDRKEPELQPFGDGQVAACHFPLQPPVEAIVASRWPASRSPSGDRIPSSSR